MQHIKQKPQVTFHSRPSRPIASDFKVTAKDIVIAHLKDTFKGFVFIAIFILVCVVLYISITSFLAFVWEG